MSGVRGRWRGRRAGGALAAAAVLSTAALGVGWAVVDRPRPAAPAPQVSTGTAAVTRGTVNERVQISGVLGFDGSYTVTHQGEPGIVTSAPEPGTVVGRGEVLYAVANQPVRLLFGGVPAYRGFAAGMADGPDVKELEENLAALGLAPGQVDEHFTAATSAAVWRWQKAWGVPAWQRTGTLPLGAVVFARAALRIAQVTSAAGTPVDAGAPVLSATSTARVVTARLSTDRQALVHAGDKVQVSLVGTAPVAGTVTRVGRVATAPSAPQGESGQSGPPTVAVTIQVDLPAAAADLDQAPVQVAITTATHRDVLLVPVVALLARPGGRYQVRLAAGGYVQVRPGLFDSSAGTVEVAGGLTVGQLVQVPAS